MQTAKCKCGEIQAWGEMPPCAICEKCGTAPGYAKAETAQPHRFSKKFDQNTGEPFNFCMVCGRKEELEGRDYFNCCRIPAHETLISFVSDRDSESFEAWFKSEGYMLFTEFNKTFKPTYKKQIPILREVMKDGR